MDFTISPDLELVIQTVRDYVDKTLLPIEMQVEHQDRIPPEILREMGDLGFFGLPFNEDDGGLGVGLVGFSLALEQLARANAADWRSHHRQQPGRDGAEHGRHAGAAQPLAAGLSPPGRRWARSPSARSRPGQASPAFRRRRPPPATATA